MKEKGSPIALPSKPQSKIKLMKLILFVDLLFAGQARPHCARFIHKSISLICSSTARSPHSFSSFIPTQIK